MSFYKTKIVVIEARQMPIITNQQHVAHDIYRWIQDEWGPSYEFHASRTAKPERGVTIDPADGCMVIMTPEGEMKVALGDYVIKGIAGEFYPCKPDIFKMKYEYAGEDPVQLLQNVTGV